MNNKTYNIFLEGTLIGTTLLEKADPPMGVVHGKIIFCLDSINYSFIKAYCTDNNIKLGTDYPEDKIISTFNIPQLKIVSDKGVEIKREFNLHKWYG